MSFMTKIIVGCKESYKFAKQKETEQGKLEKQGRPSHCHAAAAAILLSLLRAGEF